MNKKRTMVYANLNGADLKCGIYGTKLTPSSHKKPKEELHLNKNNLDRLDKIVLTGLVLVFMGITGAIYHTYKESQIRQEAIIKEIKAAEEELKRLEKMQ